jgi:hypothetical protein
MAKDTIDHATLSRLAEADLLRSAQLVGQAGGWALSVKFGVAERLLSAQRTGKVRLFRKMETAAEYLRGLGIVRFEEDSSGYDTEIAKAARRRPDRAEALKRVHSSADDKRFREAVRKLLEESG